MPVFDVILVSPATKIQLGVGILSLTVATHLQIIRPVSEVFDCLFGIELVSGKVDSYV